MDILNTLNLPDYIVNMESSYKPNPNRVGATDLTRPPLIRTLTIKHWEELQSDVKDRLKMYGGNAWDRECKRNCVWALTNIKIEIPTIDGLTIVCKPDYYHVLDYILADFKEKSVWSLVKFDPTHVFSKENVGQVNIYDWAMWKKAPSLRIDKLQLHIRGTDWRAKEKLKYGKDYPDIGFGVVDVPRWTHKEQEEYIDAQLKDVIHNPERECSDFEKMRTNDTFACYKGANKNASRVLDSEKEAQKWINSQKKPDEYKIVKRPGGCVRCENYCNVSKYCPYFRKGK